MNAIVMLLGLLLAAASCTPVYSGMSIAPGTPAHTHSDASTGGGTLALSGTLSSTKPCASGYTRITPNYCTHVSGGAFVAWADATACTARTLSGSGAQPLPADAKMVHIAMRVVALSGNAIGVRSNSISIWETATCTNLFQVYYYSAYEHAAVVAGTGLASATLTMIVPLGATNTIYTTQANAGGNGNADFGDAYIVGYFD